MIAHSELSIEQCSVGTVEEVGGVSVALIELVTAGGVGVEAGTGLESELEESQGEETDLKTVRAHPVTSSPQHGPSQSDGPILRRWQSVAHSPVASGSILV